MEIRISLVEEGTYLWTEAFEVGDDIGPLTDFVKDSGRFLKSKAEYMKLTKKKWGD